MWLERDSVECVRFGNGREEEGRRRLMMSFQWNHGEEEFKVVFGSMEIKNKSLKLKF